MVLHHVSPSGRASIGRLAPPFLVPAWAGLLRCIGLLLSFVVWSSAVQAQQTRSDDAVRAAWEKLEASDRAEVVDWFRAELDQLDSVQLGLVQHARELLEDDHKKLHEPSDDPFFDPGAHTPKAIVERRRLAPDDRRAEKELELRFEAIPERGLDPAFRYHWGRGRIERIADPSDPERIFQNALYGHPPGADLAEAVVTALLDDGTERELHLAFSHAYTDRGGRVYPGVTLYDAWCSERTMEMPDVDTLGIVHTVLDEWRKWKAPVSSGSKQRTLYDQVEELFNRARRHRGLRVALARTWAFGSPVLRDGYGPSLDAFQLVWEEAGGDPLELADELPNAKQWKRWIEKAQKRAQKRAGLEKIELRRGTLDADAWRVRYTLEWVLDGYGAFEEVSAVPVRR